MKSAYIAGPMTGYAEFNFPAFDRAREFIEGMGIVACSPADHSREVLAERGYGWKRSCIVQGCACSAIPKDLIDDLLRWDFERVMEVDMIYMLRGWEKSTGARAEHAIAVALGKEIMYERRADTGEPA